jgi:uncharacterized membrane protein YfcA
MDHPAAIITIVVAVAFVAAFTQSLAGFGTALIAMPILAPLLTIRVAAPLMTLVSVLMQVVLLVRYRSHIRLKEIWPLAAASLVGVPVGIYGLSHLDERIMRTILGAVIMAYAAYGLLAPQMPRLTSRRWAFPFGFAAGLLGGAYNTDGPPVVVYGSCRGWEPAAFKCHLQGFFMFDGLLIIAGRALAGEFTGEVWWLYLWTLPAIALGAWAGLSFDRRISPARFRKIMLCWIF